ncbi:O-methylsterigmatocystin oxidoreductase [Lineolata rhizophorae]|uniref:O-methylsterigmatocystin oxidoreductase n=1 Tax=Lineolata rhizophorae TaxID=578093 RepID=A0A6A6PFC3_9PEZI|nr:O-methylsterigmatocystin oxidoreductase [Lineolata rhizophorae]
MAYFLYALALLFAYSVFAVIWSRLKSRPPKGLRSVPGPKGNLVLGNTLQLGKHPQQDFQRWANEFGEIYKIRLGWNNWYMLNSPEAVKEIMDKQSAYTSSRMPLPVSSDVLSGGLRFLFMPYGPLWRKLRGVAHKLLTPKVSDTFQPSQDFEAKQLLYDILTDNKDNRKFYMHVRRYTVSVIMTSTYGIRVPEFDCEDVNEIYGVMNDFSEVAAPGAYLADTIPAIAEILPESLHWWRKEVLPLRKRQEVMWMKFWTSLKTKMDLGKAPECFVKQFIESSFEKEGISEIQAAFLAGSMIEAGSETTSAALNSCILYLTAYPEVVAKAHEELSRVVGDDRSPSFGDENQLPYIRSIVKEILRLRPVTNMGTPHYTTEDITYKENFIPKGSIVCIQQYAIHYDPARYPNPKAFKPERYLNHPLKSGAYAGIANPLERDHFSFGAGRRICSGIHLAENSLFITVAKILWAFDIKPPVRADGRELPVDVSDDAYEPGANTIAKPFEARFIPRNQKVEQVLRHEWDAAKREGYVMRDARVDSSGVVIL